MIILVCVRQDLWCSGRDSDPGLRLERPEYLTGLYYRSPKLSLLNELKQLLLFYLLVACTFLAAYLFKFGLD
jgi:hypothetical protein